MTCSSSSLFTWSPIRQHILQLFSDSHAHQMIGGSIQIMDQLYSIFPLFFPLGKQENKIHVRFLPNRWEISSFVTIWLLLINIWLVHEVANYKLFCWVNISSGVRIINVKVTHAKLWIGSFSVSYHTSSSSPLNNSRDVWLHWQLPGMNLDLYECQ